MRRAAIVGSVAAAFLTCVIVIMAIYIPSPSVAPSKSTQMNWLHKSRVAVTETDRTLASTKDETKATSTNETIAKIGKARTTTTGETSTTTTVDTTSYPAAVDFTITELRWAADGLGGNASLTVCSNSTLSETGQANTTVKLSCNGTGIDSTDDIIGIADANDDKCAIFLVGFNLSSSLTTYTVDVGFPNGTQKVGAVTVAVTVEMAILQCDESSYTKLSWTEPTELLNQTCIADTATLSKACYSEGDLTDTNFCFAVEGGDTHGQTYNLKVCLKKPFAYVANESADGSLAVNYVLYGDSHGIEPSLSLIYNGSVTAVIVSWDDRKHAVYGCNATECSLPGLVPAVAQYRVCGEVVGAGDANTMQTATANFTDMDLILLPDNAQERGPVLHFVFANVLPEKVYRAIASSGLPPRAYNNHSSVEVDCSLVQENHGCFGFLGIEGLTGTVYLAVYREAGESNKVVSPFDTGVTITTVVPQMMTMPKQQGSGQM